MARLADMTLGYLENLLLANPTVLLFTSVFFTDIPANSGQGSGQAYGNPTRAQVASAYQAAVDEAKYLAGVQIPVTYADPSTNSLGGKLSTSGNQAVGSSSATSGLPNQVPQNAITVTQASIAPIAQVVASADDNIQEGVLVAPPSQRQRIQTNGQVA